MDHVESELALAPLGAGDLIDRAVRLYRRHFLTLIRIAALLGIARRQLTHGRMAGIGCLSRVHGLVYDLLS